MPRYMKIRGVPGHLVADPRAVWANPARYAGMQFSAKEGAKKHEQYSPVDVAVEAPPEHGAHYRSAAKDGTLRILGECVADSLEAAERAMTAKPAAEKVK